MTDLPAAPSRARTLWLALVVIVLNASGNLSLAVGMKRIPGPMSANPFDFVRAMAHLPVAIGIALLILWLLTRMALLSWADLSFVVPVTAVGYILAAILGHFFLREPVSFMNWVGTFLIFFGTAFVGVTKPKTVAVERGGQ